MRLRNRRRHLRSHGTKPFLHLLGVAPVLHFRDHDQPLGATILDGNRRDTAAAYLLSGRLDVVGVVIKPVDDQRGIPTLTSSTPVPLSHASAWPADNFS